RVCSAPRRVAQAGLTEKAERSLEFAWKRMSDTGQPKAGPDCFSGRIASRRRRGEILPCFTGFLFRVGGDRIGCGTLAFSRYLLCAVQTDAASDRKGEDR